MKTQYNGTCKGPDKHTWNIGDEVFYDKATKVICIDSACFTKLREVAQNGGGTAKQSASTRTLEGRTQDAADQLRLLWPMCQKKALEHYFEKPELAKASELNEIDKPKYEKAMILAQVFYKCGSYVWAR